MPVRNTIRTLNRLIRTCRDGERLCRAYAEAADSPELRLALHGCSQEWAGHGDELQALVFVLNGTPTTRGTLRSLALRTWFASRTMLCGPGDQPALESWRRMQQRAIDSYAQALASPLPERVRRTVSLQAERLAKRSAQLGGPYDRPVVPSHGARSL